MFAVKSNLSQVYGQEIENTAGLYGKEYNQVLETQPVKPENSKNRLARVVSYILDNLDEPLSVALLSQECQLSRFHFHRQFQAHTGVNVGRYIQLARLKRASFQLVFNRQRRITDIAMDSGFEFPESFTRAFRREYGQTPSQFRCQPDWSSWWDVHQSSRLLNNDMEKEFMQVEIVEFPETQVAALEHHGPESQTYKTSMKFIEWRQENSISPDKGNTYGIHYTDPKNTFPEDFRMDICVSVEKAITENPQGLVNKIIPACRCAVARHLGSRDHVTVAEYLIYDWLPASGESLGSFPLFFHYVNVGPNIREQDMITDVYLPLK